MLVCFYHHNCLAEEPQYTGKQFNFGTRIRNGRLGMTVLTGEARSVGIFNSLVVLQLMLMIFGVSVYSQNDHNTESRSSMDHYRVSIIWARL